MKVLDDAVLTARWPQKSLGNICKTGIKDNENWAVFRSNEHLDS